MKKIFLFAIILLAIFLRFYNLGIIPHSASLDEASIGWNAYSVLKTRVDEFGQFPLISQRGYDDYRRSTYLLLTIPFIAIFQLSALAIRFPAAILSVLTVLALYGIVREVTRNGDKSHLTATIAALLLAINPWHVYISRLGHESNACLSFLVFGLYFFLIGKKRIYCYLISALFFLLSMISYYTGQILVPLFVFSIFIFYNKELLSVIFKNWVTKIITFCLIILTILILWSLFSPSAMIRYRGTSTLSAEAHDKEFSSWVNHYKEAKEKNNLIETLYYNRRVFFLKVLLEGYFSHYNFSWLFSNSDNGAFKAPNTGLLFTWQLPFIILGLFSLLWNKYSLRLKLLIFLWLVFGPLPAAIATQAPHAMRAYNMVPVWQILTSFGIVFVYSRTSKLKNILGLFVSIMFIYSVYTLYINYFHKFPLEQSRPYQYALVQSIPYVLKVQDNYSKIVFSNENNLFQSYMHFLFQSKYNPKLYLREGGTISGGFEETHAFGKYEFRPINWVSETNNNTLYIGNPEDFPGDYNLLYEGKYLDGTVGVKVVTRQ